MVGEEARFLLADRMEMSEHVHQDLELQTNHREDYAKFYNHGEGHYKDLNSALNVKVLV